MIKEYIFHFKKLLYVIVFGSLVWFISFTLFPENQIIKISVGDRSPTTFVAPKYIEIIDEDKTEVNKEIAIKSVSPIYSIDNDLNNSAINGITDMFLTVIEARTDEKLITSEDKIVEEEESELAVAGKYIPAELLELQGLKHDRDNVKKKMKEAETRKRTGSSMMKKYYDKREKTLLADLADIDSRMAELDESLNPPGEGEGLSADVTEDESDSDNESDIEE